MRKELGAELPPAVTSAETKILTPEEIVSYRTLIFSFLCRRLQGSGTQEDAEDLTQHVLEKALHARHTFLQTAPIKTWLLSFAINESISFFRKQQHRKTDQLDEEKEEGYGREITGEVKPDPFMRDIMALAWAQLTEQQQKYLCWSAEGQTPAWIAEQEGGMNINSVKTRMHRAKERYKELLVEFGLIE